MATYRHQLMTIDAAAKKYGIAPADLWGVYGVETSYGKNVNTSSAGAVGPFQFLPSTARGIGVNPYNFTSAAFGAAKYLSSLGYGKDRRRALGAYNGGPGNPQYGYADSAIRAGRTWPGNPAAGRAPAPARGRAPAGTAGTAPLTVVTGSTPVAPGGTPKADELTAQSQQTVGQVPVTAPAEPAYGASRFMAPVGGPLGLTPPLAGGVTRPSGPTLAQQLADVGKQQGPDLASLTTETLPGTPGTAGGRPAAQGGPMYRHPIPGARISSHDNGADFETRPGTPLRSVGSGRVVNTQGAFPGGSIVIQLDHPYHGQRFVYYGHLNDGNKEVHVGQRVAPGQIIARTSSHPAGASDMPGHTEIGFALGANGGIQTGGAFQGNRSVGSPLGALFARFLSGLR